jgi:hypothetical protein
MSAHTLSIGKAKPYEEYLDVAKDVKYPGGGRSHFAGHHLVKCKRTEKKKQDSGYKAAKIT